MTADRSRRNELGDFFARHHMALQRIVARHVSAPGTIVEDACQTAWTILCAHPDVALYERSALQWLVTTATREAWKRSRRVACHESPAGAFLPASDDVGGLELPEPAADGPDPCELALAQAEHADRVARLARLSERERLYLYLKAVGYSYKEMAELTAASTRTVERQVLRGHAKLRGPPGG